jgi:hypothetical protein
MPGDLIGALPVNPCIHPAGLPMNTSTIKVLRRQVESAVDPPIQVETATWSRAGQLDWWVRKRREWWVAYAVQTAVNGGSELLIFVPPKNADSRGNRDR